MSLRDGMMQPHDSDKNERSTSCHGQLSKNDNLDMPRTSDGSTDKDADIVLCRVCHCSECDRRGDAALSFLNIVPPSQEYLESNVDGDSSDKLPRECTLKGVNNNKTSQEQKEFVEFIGPEGEIFVCSADVESGSYFHQDTLIDLGCSCKNDLAQVHYACALKWFVSHGSTVCEICGSVAKNVRVTDFRKVMASLKDYEELRNRTVTGEFAYAHVGMNSGVDPDAVAAIRRQRLSEISLWFSSHGNSATVSQEALEEFPYNPTENVVNMETQMTKWALEDCPLLSGTTNWGCFHPITTRNRPVTIDFNRRRSNSCGISRERKKKREKKRENVEIWCCSPNLDPRSRASRRFAGRRK
ncbi:hypothetical protein B296_00005533 [Ensete ventricosum]|uniref:RING-CH-type domain-containing protein n=1 Tax=Ensete ventricosum TaxID=4639 RepID=A0A427APS0_ENSVE|nr:hypothetical protein B296_00005533 [Ensete ventricosum]